MAGPTSETRRPTARRILVAALAGAVALFVWSAISHMFIIRGIGFEPLPDEAAVEPLVGSLERGGLYFFPRIDWSRSPSDEEIAAWETRFRRGHGLVLYEADGDGPVSSKKLGLQFLGDLLAAAILAALAARGLGMGVAAGAVFGAALGVFASAGVSSLYWNWYGFSHAFFVAHCGDKIVGWLIAGAAVGWVLSRQGSAARRRPAAS
ncbi:MAG: hypothetical protein KC731_00605 [Myxococcales bacterium]|nr:hypothetical protein [Myxococcales bacterium]